ncbi:MAG: putative thermolysin family peptidase, partial [Ilumatobacteraceae bacterium]|nr:putative thermolysin family peptidase [Ilumatobacteraceae bacterium]
MPLLTDMRTSKRTLAALLCLTAGLGGVLMADVSGASAQATTNHAVRDDDGGKSDAALQAQLSSASGGHATFSFSGSGEATYIGGSEAYPLQARSGDGQELIARRFIDAYAPLFGVKNTTTDLVQTQSFTGASGAGGAVKYQQTFKGIPVIAGVLAVQVSSSGAVLSATGEASPDLAIDATSTISADQASLSGVAGVARQAGVDPSTLSADTSVLSIYDPTLLGAPDALGARLVWRFDVRDAIGGVDWFVLIDAHDGTVALQFDQQEAALNRSICDNNENTAITETCTAPVRTEGQLPVGAAHPDVDNAYDLSGATWNFYMSHFGRDSVDNAGLPLKSTVRFCYPTPQPCPYAN